MEVIIKKNKYLRWCKYLSYFFCSIFILGIIPMLFKQLAWSFAIKMIYGTS